VVGALLVTATLGAACSSATPPPAAAEPAWVGFTYAGVPPGLQRGSSALLEPLDGVAYGLVEMAATTGRMVWLEKQLGHDAGGQARWQVLAVLHLPELAHDDLVLFAGGFCTIAGAFDSELVAVVQEPAGASYVVQSAWRARRAAARFEPVGAGQVECVDPGHDPA
jgi:hypothetical protein